MKPRPITDLRDEMLAVARGERLAPPALPTAAKLTPEMRELLRAIEEQHPATFENHATITKKAQPSSALRGLVTLGLVRLVTTGREVRPEPRERRA